jgi:peptidoglycan/LPS O-acetylase OafA/YrhL
MFYPSTLILSIFISCIFISCFLLRKINIKNEKFDSLSRQSPLDGLRGLLALSVLVHHFAFTYNWKTLGIWMKPESNVLNNLGAIPVSLFFIITGYLFFNKVIYTKDINWKNLYLSRFKRIVPLYFFVTIILIIITFFSMNFFRDIDKDVIFVWLINWFFFKGGPLLDFKSNLIISGVNWTLLYEWAFYFSLPLFHLIIQKRRINKLLLIITFLILIAIISKTQLHLYFLFLLAIPSILCKQDIKEIILKNKLILNIFTSLLIIYCLIFTLAYSLIQKLLVAIIFILICNGISLFGLLNNIQIKILGDISYSIYLTHGLVLYFIFSILNLYDFKNGLINYYFYFPIIFFIVIVLSILTYLFIERPFLRK